jgi:hypothetical protein
MLIWWKPFYHVTLYILSIFGAHFNATQYWHYYQVFQSALEICIIKQLFKRLCRTVMELTGVVWINTHVCQDNNKPLYTISNPQQQFWLCILYVNCYLLPQVVAQAKMLRFYRDVCIRKSVWRWYDRAELINGHRADNYCGIQIYLITDHGIIIL